MKEIQLYRGLLGGQSGTTKLKYRFELRWEGKCMDGCGQAGKGGGASDKKYHQLQSLCLKKPSPPKKCAFTVLDSLCTTPLSPAYLSSIPSRLSQ